MSAATFIIVSIAIYVYLKATLNIDILEFGAESHSVEIVLSVVKKPRTSHKTKVDGLK
jgi:hypothetical protein